MLTRLADSLGIKERVCFAGWVKDMNSFYHAIDINLLTSLSETFPYALTEGARMHRATIASRVGGVPVLIDDGKNGLIFPPGDENQLASCLIQLADDQTLRNEMGEQLYQKASTEFSIDRMVEHQLEIYESILERERRKQEMQGKRDGVIICGAYGHGNAGDDAILKSIIQSVQKLDRHVPITVLAKNTESIKKRYRVDSIYTLNVPKMLLAMRKSKLYINGGGTLIQNATSHRSLWYYLFTLRAAKLLGNKVDMYGCGIGPVTGNRDIALVKKVLERSADIITLREQDSMDELQSFGVKQPEILLSSDPALALGQCSQEDTELYLKKHGLSPEGKYLCFMLRTWYGFAEKAKDFAKCAEYAYDLYGLTPVFLSLNIYHDTTAALQVIEHLSCPYHILDEGTEPEMLISALSYMDVVVSMRLHGLILSSLSGIPLVGVSYDPKIGSFLKYLGYGTCLELGEVTAEKLTADLDKAAAQIPDRETLRQHADRLLAVEKHNSEAVKKLLEISN